jgi:hypothetical protein
MTTRSWSRQLFASPAARPSRQAPAWVRALTIGFGLGGGLLGTVSCLLGVCLPDHHPVAVALSVLGGALYFGCVGARVGALVGVHTDRAPPRPAVRWEPAREVARELELDSQAAPAGSTAVCAPRGPRGRPGHQRERERPA